jgi:hypothetical protein
MFLRENQDRLLWPTGPALCRPAKGLALLVLVRSSPGPLGGGQVRLEN